MTLTLSALLLSTASMTAVANDQAATKAELGERLFFDTRLSLNQTQSCATCHDPSHAFTDPRDTVRLGVSLGDDGHSTGTRNAPTASYASFSPSFHQLANGNYKGGQFYDGRAATLADQALGPPLNPVEMGMPDSKTLMHRIESDLFYQKSFTALFGEKVFSDSDKAYRALGESIAAYENTPLFAPFDSKYDRYLRGEYSMTAQEELGRTLFFSQQFTNCNQCHQLARSPIDPQETFTNYEYHNIGTPANPRLAAAGLVPNDQGLNANNLIKPLPTLAGKIKVPTLRNVAVTAPYMHNGVFKDLRTVILFYDHYNSRSKARQLNPETGQPWAAPEVAENISMKELQSGPALDNRRVDALIAFLKTLTDQRYEHLLAEQDK